MRLVIVGGSDAGISAALRARRIAPDVEVDVVVADRYPNYSICGIPYYLAGSVSDWRDLAHRSIEELEATGMRLHLDHVAQSIDVSSRKVTVVSTETGEERVLGYESLVVGTGATPVVPPIQGLDILGPDQGVHLLHTMADTHALAATLARHPRQALIVGAGYIGLEMAEALSDRNLTVTLVEQLDQVLPTVDAQLAEIVQTELCDHGVDVVTGTAVTAVRHDHRGIHVTGTAGFDRTVDVVLVSVGVRPDTGLLTAAGAATGVRGAIAVDTHMRTNLPGVFAAGDCVHTHHRLLPEPAYLPLGTTAHKQGRVAGENAVGGNRTFAGSLGTQVVKIFSLAAARTGLRDDEASTSGYRPRTTGSTPDDHKRYYPGAQPIHIRLTGDDTTGQLLGVQMVAALDTGIAKRIDVAAAALHHGATVDQLNDLDLSYTPPLGSPWDPLQLAAQAWAS